LYSSLSNKFSTKVVHDYEPLSDQSKPQIQKYNLANITSQMAELGQENIYTSQSQDTIPTFPESRSEEPGQEKANPTIAGHSTPEKLEETQVGQTEGGPSELLGINLPTDNRHESSTTPGDVSADESKPEVTKLSEPPPDGIKNPSMLRTSWWWLEIVATVLSIGCMASVIGILAHTNGKPLNDWTFYFSINSVISTLTTIGKSCMMVAVAESISQLKWQRFEKTRHLTDMQLFDAASRGPAGATNLIWSMKADALIATGGAIITIFALAIGPFTQIVLQFPTNTVKLPNESPLLGVGTDYVSKAFPSSDVSK
jgi:hypothetical protein